jgi:uncharacterized protein YcfL
MKKLTIIFLTSLSLLSCQSGKQIKNSAPSKVENLKTQKNTASQKKKTETIKVDEDNIQKATISKSYGLISITANMKLDHRIFGFEKPNLNSKKMILISIFTNDVEKNSFNCPYGAYYDSHRMAHIKLKFKENIDEFSRVELTKENESKIIYFEKKWLEFE